MHFPIGYRQEPVTFHLRPTLRIKIFTLCKAIFEILLSLIYKYQISEMLPYTMGT